MLKYSVLEWQAIVKGYFELKGSFELRQKSFATDCI